VKPTLPSSPAELRGLRARRYVRVSTEEQGAKYGPDRQHEEIETAFLGQVLELAAIYGWQAAHFRPALTGRGWRTPVQGSLGKGWPDLVLIRGTRLIFVELKASKGKLHPDQERVLNLLGQAAEIHVWFPADFDRIVETLR